MTRIIAIGIRNAALLGSLAGCASANGRLSPADIQGAWWSSCNDPAAEFVISGDAYSGDFAGNHDLGLDAGVLVFKDGLLEGHGVDLPGQRRAFHIVSASAGNWSYAPWRMGRITRNGTCIPAPAPPNPLPITLESRP